MSETYGRSTQQLFSEAKAIHSSHRTQSTELENKLDFMQKKIQDHSSFLSCGFCTRSTKKVDDAFKRAFKTLSLTEQVTLFWKMCTLVRQIKQKKNLSEELDIKNPQKQMLDTTIYIKDGRDYKVWTVTRIKASLKTKKIFITDTSAVLDMHDYLIRHAKNKQRQCFALEATNLHQALQTIKISNEGHGFDETIKFFKKMKKRALFDEICALIDPGILQQHQVVETKPLSTSRVARKASIKITSLPFEPGNMSDKMMTLKLVSPEYSKKPMKQIQRQILQRECVIRLRDSSYNQIYKALVPPKLIQKADQVNGEWQKVQNTEECEVYYHRKEQKVKKIYRFKCSDIVLFDWIVDEINNFSNFKKWKPNMERIQCLKIFPSQKTKVYHEVCKHEANNRVNYVFIRHYFNLPNPHYIGQNSRKFHCYYDQSVTSPIAKQYFLVGEPLAQISYILWKFYEEKDAVNLVIEAKCDHFTTPQKNLKMVETYLGKFEMLKKHAANYADDSQIDSDVILNTLMFENQYIQKIDEIQDIDHDTEYYTVTDSNNTGKENTLLGKKTPQQNLNVSHLNKSIVRRVSFQDENSPSQTNCLKFRHPVFPYKKGKPKLVMPSIPGQHFHWEKQWIINGKGELINTNQEKIQAQNNVLKNVIKRLGRNIFKGKGILSISLPVDAFGEDSNLSRLCNSYGYAPVFLEQAAKLQDPLERFKKVMSFGISASVIYIRMDKPFNPILGETYQSLIDGCPVYGEQISHHPPISAVFLKGRGYTLYGHLEAKVEMSMNSASGINDGQIHVSFDQENLSKRQVMYTSPAGQLGGLIFGDRKMSLIKRSVYFDPENLIYCELKWSKQKGKSDFINKFYDAVEGEIVKLKAGFNLAAWKGGVKKEQIEKEYGLINGRWTGAVFYDDQLLFDTYTTYPHKVQYYHAMLESDVEKRKDLLLRRNAVDMEPAQAAKQELQQIQRNDRKLRAQYGKGGH